MENFYQKIEQYLLGELTGNDLSAFESALQSDPELAKSVAQHREMMQRLDALRIRNKVASSMASRPAAKHPALKFWILAILLALSAGAIWLLNRPGQITPALQEKQNPPVQTDTPKAPAEETLRPIAQQSKEKLPENKSRRIALARNLLENPPQTSLRNAVHPGASSKPKTPVQLAVEAFNARNFQLASELLKDDSLVETGDIARFIRANARFNTGQFTVAANDFDALKNSFQFKHEARWNFLLCQLALGNMDRVKALLADMLAEKDFPFREKARKLHSEIINF